MDQGFLRSVAKNLRHTVVAAVAAGLLAGGCALKDTGANEPWDPIEGANRFVFSLNRAIDIIAIRPLAVTYRDWVPERGQRGVHNVLENLGEPVTAINELVQGDPGRAVTTLARFIVNSTIGIAGIFDVAASMGLAKTKEGAGNTVGYYAGVEPENGGFYMVLPLAGPSNARDAAGLMADYAVDPFRILTYALNVDWLLYSGPRWAATVVDVRSRTLYALDDLEKNSVDYYAALRSAYTQQRADVIRQKREKTDSRGELERRDNLALVR
jgi:phospholipid-binding lipoprotein MlaA